MPTTIQLDWAYFKFGAGDVDLAVIGDWLYQLAQIATEVIDPSTLKFGEKKDRKENWQKPQSMSYTNAANEKQSDPKKYSSSTPGKSKCYACYGDSETKEIFHKLKTDGLWLKNTKFVAAALVTIITSNVPTRRNVVKTAVPLTIMFSFIIHQ